MNRKAFSLAEMMVVMLILSIIIAASMPIITKRTAATESPNQNKIPPGSIMAYGGTTAPSGWLLCNGQSTNGHQELAAVVGANVPDLRGEFIRGWDNGRGVDVGRGFKSWQAATRIMVDWSAGGGAGNFEYSISDFGNQATNPDLIENGAASGWVGLLSRSSTTSVAYYTAYYVRPRNIALNYIIKY